MPSASSRSRTAPKRSPRAAGRVPAPEPERPTAAPFAVVFGLLVAAEVLYLGYLLWEPAPAFDWYLVVPVLVAAATVTAAVLVLLGKPRSWLLLAGAALVVLLALLVLVFVFAALGATAELWSAVLLLVGPIGCLVLATRPSVRRWAGRSPATRSPAGRRGRGGGR